MVVVVVVVQAEDLRFCPAEHEPFPAQALDLLELVKDVLAVFDELLRDDLDLLRCVRAVFAKGVLEEFVSVFEGVVAARGDVE